MVKPQNLQLYFVSDAMLSGPSHILDKTSRKNKYFEHYLEKIYFPSLVVEKSLLSEVYEASGCCYFKLCVCMKPDPPSTLSKK